MVVYNISAAGFVPMDLIKKLIGLPSVKGLEYTACSYDEMGSIVRYAGEDFMVFFGCDEMAFSVLGDKRRN